MKGTFHHFYFFGGFSPVGVISAEPARLHIVTVFQDLSQTDGLCRWHCQVGIKYFLSSTLYRRKYLRKEEIFMKKRITSPSFRYFHDVVPISVTVNTSIGRELDPLGLDQDFVLEEVWRRQGGQ